MGMATEADMGRTAEAAGQGNPELTMIIKALIDRVKQIGKAEEQARQFSPMPPSPEPQPTPMMPPAGV
jgi:hypothetical protein